MITKWLQAIQYRKVPREKELLDATLTKPRHEYIVYFSLSSTRLATKIEKFKASLLSLIILNNISSIDSNEDISFVDTLEDSSNDDNY